MGLIKELLFGGFEEAASKSLDESHFKHMTLPELSRTVVERQQERENLSETHSGDCVTLGKASRSVNRAE